MKIVIAPDSFKESLTAMEAAQAIHAGFYKVFPDAEYVLQPMADGGEGTAATLLQAKGGQWQTVKVHDPLMRPITARYARLADGRAVIESAEVIGLSLLKACERNPLVSTSYGLGELIVDALNSGVRSIVLAIGGSASNDGGAGMLQALGAKLVDGAGESIGVGGGALIDLARIDLSSMDKRLAKTSIKVACDVNNPLCGAQGASVIFAPQKGADSEMVTKLEIAMQHYAAVVSKQLDKDYSAVKGVGAAGGLGFALLAFCAAELCSGAKLMIEALGLQSQLVDADLVITGEGQFDRQSMMGKVPFALLECAKPFAVPVMVLCGALMNTPPQNGDDFVIIMPCLNKIDAPHHIFANAKNNLEYSAHTIARAFALGVSFVNTHK